MNPMNPGSSFLPKLENFPWPPATLTQSEPEASYSPGITKALELLQQINALHLTFVGTCSKLSTNSPPSIGTDAMRQRNSLSVTFANYQATAQAYIIAALAAEQRFQHDQLMTQLGHKNIGDPTQEC